MADLLDAILAEIPHPACGVGLRRVGSDVVFWNVWLGREICRLHTEGVRPEHVRSMVEGEWQMQTQGRLLDRPWGQTC